MASKRHVRRGCTGKRTYTTQADAGAAMVALAGKKRIFLHTYRCPHCQKWHLGSDVGKTLDYLQAVS